MGIVDSGSLLHGVVYQGLIGVYNGIQIVWIDKCNGVIMYLMYTIDAICT